MIWRGRGRGSGPVRLARAPRQPLAPGRQILGLGLEGRKVRVQQHPRELARHPEMGHQPQPRGIVQRAHLERGERGRFVPVIQPCAAGGTEDAARGPPAMGRARVEGRLARDGEVFGPHRQGEAEGARRLLSARPAMAGINAPAAALQHVAHAAALAAAPTRRFRHAPVISQPSAAVQPPTQLYGPDRSAAPDRFSLDSHLQSHKYDGIDGLERAADHVCVHLQRADRP